MESYEFPIEAGHIMAFARSLGDDNPRYFRDASSDAVDASPTIAPPTFAQASVRFLPKVPSIDRADESVAISNTRESEGESIAVVEGNQLHAEQHFEYRRPVVAGEVLRVTTRDGDTWQKEGRRGGTLTFKESFTEFVDADGDVVVLSRSVAVWPSRVVDAG